MITRFSGQYDFLSNFYPCKILYEGIEYPSTEHAYQAQKTLDNNIRKEIASLSTPGESKRAGRNLTIRKDWNEVRVGVMYELNLIKYSQSNDLKQKLLATGKVDLIEGNHWNDTFWGVCKGKGKNMLGKILMSIRQLFQEKTVGP